jgi:hypothetical protein
MHEERGRNLWDFHATGAWIVIPTNLGWRRNGTNVMGRGLALQAAQRYPDLPREYGQWCQNRGYLDLVIWNTGEDKHLIMAPSKPLDSENPHLSWQQPADPELVKRSLTEIYDFACTHAEDFGLPLLGTGNGGLDRKLVLDMTREILGEIEWCYLYL